MFKKIFAWIVGTVLAVGAGIAYLLGSRSKRNDGPGNIGEIRDQLDSEGKRLARERAALAVESGEIDSERTDIDRERESIERETGILDSDKKLIAELKKRFKK